MKILFVPGLKLAKHVLQRESLIDEGLKMVFLTSDWYSLGRTIWEQLINSLSSSILTVKQMKACVFPLLSK